MDACSATENSSAHRTRKRYAESDSALIFMIGPGGQPVIVTKQMPGAQSDVPQGPGSSQTSPSAIVGPLSATTVPGNVGPTPAADSSALIDTTAQPLSTSGMSAGSLIDSAPMTSIASESTPSLVSTSTFVIPSSAVAAESSLQATIPSTVSSEAVDLKPPVYVGIVLGTIAGLACLTALIAWGIRIRSHAKRRLYGNTDVPWAPSESADSGLEEPRDKTLTRSNLDSLGFGSREDLAQVEAWEPRGDRDVGEPRRSECYPNSSIGLSRPFVPSADDTYPHRPAVANQFLPDSFLPFIQPIRSGPYPNARPLPSYLRSINSSSSGSIDDHSMAPSLGPLRVANLLPGDRSAATSRAGTALGMNNQTYSLGGEDFEDLTGEDASRSENRLDKCNNSSYSWKSPAHDKQEVSILAPESEGWTSSLKSIFSVMASNLSMHGRNVRGGEDTLTPIPRKRSALRSAAPTETNIEQNGSPGPDGNRMDPFEPGMSWTGKRGTKSRQLRRDLLSRKHGLRGATEDTPSRASSIYSTYSANCQIDDTAASTLSRNSTYSANRPDSIHEQFMGRRAEASTVSRPPAITRVSSTGCSVASTQLTDNEDAAQRALIDRRRRAKRSDSGMEREANCEYI